MTIRFGKLLSEIRQAKIVTMLELKIKIGLSASHIWALESGKVHPDEDIIYKLQQALEMSPEEISKIWEYSDLDNQDYKYMRGFDIEYAWSSIKFLLESHMPYPSILLDDRMNIVKMNIAAYKLLLWLLGLDKNNKQELLNKPLNLLELILQDERFKSHISNWGDVAINLVEREHIDNRLLEARIEQIFNLLSAKELISIQSSSKQTSTQLVTTLSFCKDGLLLNLEEVQTKFLFKTQDCSLDNMVISSYLPKNKATEKFFNHL